MFVKEIAIVIVILVIDWVFDAKNIITIMNNKTEYYCDLETPYAHQIPLPKHFATH
jgi:hypothetical protein